MRQAMCWVAAAAFSVSAGAVAAQDLMERSVADLARMVKDREVTAVELVEAAIAAAREHQDLNAIITLDEDGALEDAASIDAAITAGLDLGPLAGVPLVFKDNINAKGILTTAGTPALNFVPSETAPTAARLEAFGAIVIGKANMHELAFGITSDNGAFGPVRNPADKERFAGGSSGGTAAAIAAGIVPAGLGTDTGGSVRIPAALTGIVGFRPSTWRYSQEGVVPISATRDVIGPMARSVSDVALLNELMGGGRVLGLASLEGVRFGLARPHADNLSSGTEAVFEAAVERLKAAGAIIVDVDMSEIVARAGKAGFPIALYEVREGLANFIAQHEPELSLETLVDRIASPDVKGIFTNAVMGENAVPEAAYEEALAELGPISEAYLALLTENDLDAVIFPTTPLPAQPVEGTTETVTLNGEEVPTFPTFIRNTDPASIYGAPGLSLPMGTTPEGLPVGLEIDGRPDGDIDLLTIGLAVEAALAAQR